MRVKVSIRLDEVIVAQLRAISDKLGWTFSDVVRYLISTSMSMLHPYAKASAKELTSYIEREVEDGEIAVWKVVKFVSPIAIEKIREFEEKLKNR